jgi:ribosomal protein L21E
MKSKRLREKGKIRLSEYFKKLEQGDKVAVKRELAVTGGFPARIEGKTGTVEKAKGKAYIVKIREFNKEKNFIIHPIHLKKLK